MTRRYGMGPQEARQAARELEPSRIIEPPRHRQRRDQQSARRRTAGQILNPEETFEINLLELFISMGAASGPVTGKGFWAGLNGSDWEWRVGDPAGDYLHWSGSTLAQIGNLVFQQGAGAPVSLKLFASSNGGQVEFYEDSTGMFVARMKVVTEGGADSLEIEADDYLLLSAISDDVILDAPSGYIQLRNLPTSDPGGSDRVWNNAGVLNIT